MSQEFGLIGRGISHSFSADYFNGKFRDEGIDARYMLFDLPEVSHFRDIIAAHPDLIGLNVTSPYKRDIIPFLDSLSPEAEDLEAVNVIRIITDRRGRKKLHGHNTDCRGFEKTLEGLIGKDVRAIVLGTGGASSAVCYALRKKGIEPFITSRNPKESEISYPEASRLIPDISLIINATPVGMHPHIDSFPDIDYSLLTPSHICYDLIYNPAETGFLKKAAAQGARTVNGLQMLLNQAELSWQIWNDSE